MDRQFSEDEAREVFARAAERQQADAARGQGLSLDELREIGRAAGLDPAHVEAAARSVALGAPEHGRTMVGPVPRGVYRTVTLAEPPSDALWAHVVADARRTFEAQGKTTEVGPIREWRNGNLRVSLEPAGDGSRLHLRSHRSDVPQVLGTGAVFALAGLVVGLLSLVGAAGAEATGAWAGMILLGLAMAGVVWIRQSGWTSSRERQFEEVARRAETAGTAASPVRARIDPGLLHGDSPVGEEPDDVTHTAHRVRE